MRGKTRLSDEEYEAQEKQKVIDKSIYVEVPSFMSARGITWKKISGYFEGISDVSLLLCAIFAVIQPFSPYLLYNWEVALFACFVVFGISHFLANSFNFQETSGIVEQKRRKNER
jgi:hypothetical protein